MTLLRRVAAGHPRSMAAFGLLVMALLLLPYRWDGATRAVVAWDLAAGVLLGLFLHLAVTEPLDRMPENARLQEEGEWTVFWITLLGSIISVAALIHVFGRLKAAENTDKTVLVLLVCLTLLLTWLVIHAVFALRYAHEYYEACRPDGTKGGLDFPGDLQPDYWDFMYFSYVLGMTFQVSDVQVTSRPMRRLVLVHGLLSFGFNTVLVALTVNLVAGLL